LVNMRKKHPFEADQVKQVAVRVSVSGFPKVNNSESPDLCLQYLVAVMLLDKTVSFRAAHDKSRMQDPKIMKERAKVILTADEELERILQSAPEWDKRVQVLQVTDATEKSMQIRVLVSSFDSGLNFDLRCRVREGLLSFVQSTYAQFLPRTRADLSPEGEHVDRRDVDRPVLECRVKDGRRHRIDRDRAEADMIHRTLHCRTRIQPKFRPIATDAGDRQATENKPLVSWI